MDLVPLPLVLLCTLGCGTARPRAYSVEVAVPEGMNCYGSLQDCFWAVRTSIEHTLSKTLQEPLARKTGFRARFELLDMRHLPVAPDDSEVRIGLRYRFTLLDTRGTEVVRMVERIEERESLLPRCDGYHSATLCGPFEELLQRAMNRIRLATISATRG